ncbi:MAG: alcohol dehydrogenase catalytic domain-containing protein, partial [Gemmatimonadales bacterium]
MTEPGGPDVLRLEEVDRPILGAGAVLVRVHAAGLNRADLLQRMGRYPAPPGAPPDIPGLEFAGEVGECGDGVTEWRPGDRVMGLASGGAYAEWIAVDAGHVVRIPDDWTFETAAAVPEAFVTAHDALVQGRLEAGEHLLIHAVGSGVGVALLQLGRAMGASVIGTSRTGWKLERAAELGLDRGVLVVD